MASGSSTLEGDELATCLYIEEIQLADQTAVSQYLADEDDVFVIDAVAGSIVLKVVRLRDDSRMIKKHELLWFADCVAHGSVVLVKSVLTFPQIYDHLRDSPATCIIVGARWPDSLTHPKEWSMIAYVLDWRALQSKLGDDATVEHLCDLGDKDAQEYIDQEWVDAAASLLSQASSNNDA